MTKKISYIITILCTLLTVGIILLWSNREIESYKNSCVGVNTSKKVCIPEVSKSEKSSGGNEKSINVSENNSESKVNSDSDKLKEIKDASKGNSEKRNNNISSKKDEIAQSEKNKNTQQINNKKILNENEKVARMETVSVFKVSKDDIKSKLSLADKEKILNAATKLSPVDYAKIKKYIESEDSEEGIKMAMKLLKERLSEKDYNKVREVASKFLNMELIEK